MEQNRHDGEGEALQLERDAKVRVVANGDIRFGLSHETTEDEIDRALTIVRKFVNRLASMSVAG